MDGRENERMNKTGEKKLETHIKSVPKRERSPQCKTERQSLEKREGWRGGRLDDKMEGGDYDVKKINKKI